MGEHDRVHLGARGDVAAATAALRALPAVQETTAADHGIDLLVTDARSALAEIVRVATDAGADVGAVEVQEPNLEAVFLHLTGKALRDEG
jgi:ABC-2 type transport system ATP-binding protein